MSASCSMAPESRRSDSMGRRWVAPRLSLARDSWDRQITGTFSSFAISFRERDISDTICWRLSLARAGPPAEVISWR